MSKVEQIKQVLEEFPEDKALKIIAYILISDEE